MSFEKFNIFIDIRYPNRIFDIRYIIFFRFCEYSSINKLVKLKKKL